MNPLIIEGILTSSYLPGVTDRNGNKVKAKPSDKIVLCAIARCQMYDTSLISGVSKVVLNGKGPEASRQKEVCDMLDKKEPKITVALIARLAGYSWNRANDIITRLKRFKVISKDLSIGKYTFQIERGNPYQNY